jgi:hypothetical protein
MFFLRFGVDIHVHFQFDRTLIQATFAAASLLKKLDLAWLEF